MDKIVARDLIDRRALEIRECIAGGKLYGHPVDINNKNDCILGAYVLGQTEHDKLGYVSTIKPLSPPPHEAGGPSTPRPNPPKPEEYVLRQPKPRLGQVTNSYSQSDDRIIWLVVGMTITIISILATLVAYGLLVQYVIR